IRALRSPAISERASVISVLRKLSLNPRTPTSAATPTATDSTTNANLPGADFRSRHAIAAARSQPSARSAIFLPVLDRIRNQDLGCTTVRRGIFDNHAIFQHDLAI